MRKSMVAEWHEGFQWWLSHYLQISNQGFTYEMGPHTQLFGFSLLELFPPKWIYYLILIHIYIYTQYIYIDYISYIPPKDRWGNNFHQPFWGEIMLGPLPTSCKVSHRSCQGVLGRLGFARQLAWYNKRSCIWQLFGGYLGMDVWNTTYYLVGFK